MNPDDITKEQWQRVQAVVGPLLNYLGRLKDRMMKAGLAPNDRLYQAAVAAWDKVYSLNIHLHCKACGAKEWNGYPGGVTFKDRRPACPDRM